MNTVPFRVAELVRGDDGELYHLPTLRLLWQRGQLAADSVGYRVLLSAHPELKSQFN